MLPTSNIGSLLKTICIATAKCLYRARSPTGNGSHCVSICGGDGSPCCICVGDVFGFGNGSHFVGLCVVGMVLIICRCCLVVRCA